MKLPLLLAMKLITLLLLLGFQVYAVTGSGQDRISLDLHKSSIRNVLNQVEKQTSYRFVYHTGTLPEGQRVSISVQNAELSQVLSRAFAGLGLDYVIKEDNLVVIRAAGQPVAPDRIVKGRVTGASNEPLPGVAVRVTGTNTGTATDGDGRFAISVGDAAKTLEFSLLGFVSQQVTIGQLTEFNVVLQPSTTSLGEVVVTGYTGYNRSKSVSAATTIGADKINEVPAATFEQALQGRVPGLQVNAVSGQPGTSANVTLRGIGTIAGNTSVLYVMDGVPIEAGAFQAINPGDIESVTVLKDASAKALYGSRGSNGVIVITTKKGKSGKVAVEYRSQYGVSTLTTPRFNMMNSAERKEFEEGIGVETGAEAGPFWTYSKLNPDYGGYSSTEKTEADRIVDSLLQMNTDWRDLFMRNGKYMEQQVSASGGNENIRFYTSLNYFDQQGLVRVSDMKRYTVKNNLDFTAGKFSANLNANVGYSKSNLIQQEGSTAANNPLSAVYYALPYEYPYAPDGKLVTTGDGADYPVLDLREGSDSYERMLNTSKKQNQLKMILSTSLNYEIIKGLVAKTRLGIDYKDLTTEDWFNPDSYAGRRVSNGNLGSYGEGVSRRTSVISTSGLTYTNVLNSKHEVEVSGYFEYLKNTFRSFGYTGYGLDPRLPRTPAGVGDPGTYTPLLSGGKSSNATASFIGLLRYTYNNKYTFNGSYRHDGSSMVPENNRWHGFYSAGVSWEAKREAFLADADFLAVLRFRASYGTTASQFLNDFAYLATFERASYGGNPAIVPNQPGNADYDWEYAKELNIGFDIGLTSSNRIRLTAEYYNRITSNLFIDQRLSFTAGVPDETLPISSGKMRNRGVEIDLQGDIVRRADLTWTVGLNMAYNKNKVLDLGGADEFEHGYTGIIRVGLPFGAHYAPKWAGVDPANGDPLYYDIEGKITTDYDAATMSVAEFGTYIPELTGGFNTGITWKNFYANALLSFNAKVMRYNNEDYFNENPSFITSNQSTRLLYDRWKKPGDNAILPRISADRNFTSRDIQDASFLRLRNANIGYNLPKHVLNNLRIIKGATIYVQGQNLFTWTKWRGFDPENGNEYARFSYPTPRTYVVGLNVNF
ncbi:SusC/RagA family TonB-linked outer membrane protein [Chitinophaga sp. 22620]|uniref:SusC/RagA family TonB-linked outer membrane protein n=1 Tax=Chitinophaga sp. 22620 TaxID=3453952 RepID=UPI003F85493B